MWGKHFACTYEGSMYGAGLSAFAVWGWVISHTVDSVVEINPDMVAGQLGCTSEVVQEALAYLTSPDPRSRNHDEDGCRLVHQDGFAYFVPSHAHYRGVRNEAERREYFRVKKAEQRERDAAKRVHKRQDTSKRDVKMSTAPSASDSTSGSVVVVPPKDENPDFTEFWSLYPKRAGNSKVESLRVWGKRMREKVDAAAVLDGARRYAAYVAGGGAEGRFIKQAQTFLGPDRAWESDWTPPSASAGGKIDPLDAVLAEAQDVAGFVV